ncbi:MAG: acyl-CoA synthetase [Solirubrobacteraceae bacterium]|jgi:fatty-acyl-CoA synthase
MSSSRSGRDRGGALIATPLTRTGPGATTAGPDRIIWRAREETAIVDVDVRSLLGGSARLAGRVGDEAYYIGLCIRAGLLRPEPPYRLARMLRAFERRGLLAAPVTISALRAGDDVAMRDERGAVTYRELDERTNALANAWRAHGLRAGEGVAILARNHRGFLYAVFAAAKCGAKIVLLNTSFAGPQIREVATREGTDLLVFDDEYATMLAGIEPPHGHWRAWTDDPADAGLDTLEALIARGSTAAPPKPQQPPRIVILTSGTTGTPKGAPRSEPRSLSLVGGLLSKVPFRAREVTELCVPMFHALGFTHMVLGIALGSELVVRRHFDPKVTLDSLHDHRVTALVVVPVMLRRILDLGDEAVHRRDLQDLRIIFVGGSQFGADLARRSLETFGPIVYNLYGSTEVAYATIATPQDLEQEPGCVGGVVHGTVVKILGDDDREVPAGVTGRIFVANSSQFEGYTGGETKEQIGGLMSTGDVGHFDAAGRLFIDGRDDEMIVSGGENVFPGEVEELLAGHPAIAEVAAIGVPDESFGQRLRAYVVLRDGEQLTEDDAKAYVRENLARYKVPREIVFLDELPRNPTGKVLKRHLDEGSSR